MYAGVAYVGNVGGTVMDVTALGDTVNVAARLQGRAASGELLLAAEVQAVCEDLYPNGELRTLDVKGRKEAVAAFSSHL